MHTNDNSLPQGAVKVGSTPSFTQDTVPQGLLNNHLAPKGKFGCLVVEQGSLEFVWEDDSSKAIKVTPEQPVLIHSERFHHLVITGEVLFHVDFYRESDKEGAIPEKMGERPGQSFIS
ncbi:DUF1971 domain-containing protein [Dongshaea marina]|uniref:DUF1971 domain-containing protein n=1 Tax=Dongshaea marina TaxID=2047966 RepID=UPI000D3E2015|nr:DUF1971 domain-containing protein [Dongshaea marina]